MKTNIPLKPLYVLALSIFLTSVQPSSAWSQMLCRDVYSETPQGVSSGRQAIADAVPAMGHLTTVDGLIGMLQAGSMRPFNDIKKDNPNAKKAIGGSSSSVYLAPLFSSKAIQTPDILQGPTFILSPSVLLRGDYFFNNDWDGFGGFSYTKGLPSSSTPAADATPENVRKGAEFMFANEISLQDYAAAVVIPTEQRQDFEAKSQALGIDPAQYGITVIYADALPSIEQIAAIAKRKTGIVPTGKYSREHPNVSANFDYYLGSFEKGLQYVENPSYRETPLFKVALEKLDWLFDGGWAKTFDLKYRLARVFIENRFVSFRVFHALTASVTNASEQAQVMQLLGESSLPSAMQEALWMKPRDLNAKLTVIFKKYYSTRAVLEFALDPANKDQPEVQMLAVALDSGYLENEIRYFKGESLRQQILINAGGYPHQYFKAPQW